MAPDEQPEKRHLPARRPEPGQLRRATDRVPGDPAAQAAMGVGLAAAAAAALGAPAEVWIAVGVIGLLLTLIAVYRWLRPAETAAVEEGNPGAPLAQIELATTAQPDDQRSPDERLADEAERHAAHLRGLCAEWEGRRLPRDDRFITRALGRERIDEAISGCIAQYHREYQVDTERLFARLEERGVLDKGDRPLLLNPRSPDDIIAAAGELREGAIRLRKIIEQGDSPQRVIGPSPFLTGLARVIGELGVAAEDIRNEAPARSDKWVAEAVAKWRADADRRLAAEGADRLRAAVARDEVKPPAGEREHIAYLNRQNALLKRTLAQVRGGVQPPVDRLELLRAAYRNGDTLHRQLPWLRGAPTNRDEANEAERLRERRVIEWVRETYDMLAEHFPGQERKFFPETDPALSGTGIWLAVDEQLKTQIAETFMDDKLKFLAGLIEREEARQ